MTENEFALNIGVDIIQSNHLPQHITNKDTGELEIIHMVQVRNIFYVSEELYSALNNKIKRVDCE